MARRFIERFGAAPEYVFSLIEKHQIRCEPARNGTIHAAHAPSALKGLRGATTNGGGSAPRSRC
jgi:hypothetical protein